MKESEVIRALGIDIKTFLIEEISQNSMIGVGGESGDC
jgi:hypothetical protein